MKSALQGVYKDASRVDDALVSSICTAAEREGAFRAFVRILTGPPGTQTCETLPITGNGSCRHRHFLVICAIRNSTDRAITYEQGLVRSCLCRMSCVRCSSFGGKKTASRRWTFLWDNTLSTCRPTVQTLRCRSFRERVIVSRMTTREL